MADVSQIAEPIHLPLTLSVRPESADHRFQGRAVLPAVDAMDALAEAVRRHDGTIDVREMVDIHFDKFLSVPDGADGIPALCAIAGRAHGVQADLVTRNRLPSGMSRTKTHATAVFGAEPTPPPELPIDLAAALEGVCCRIPSDTLYRELVPFGPAYRNLVGTLLVSEDGALGDIRAPAGSANLLGSPFVLDAAFHAACVWGQRHAGIVAFPVGMAQRRILEPTRPGDAHTVRVRPMGRDAGALLFDIWIYDRTGRLCESASGVRMRDVSGGRWQPPSWIRLAGAPREPAFRSAPCRAVSVIERDAVRPSAVRALSAAESARYRSMGPDRRIGFLAARMACKRVSRKLSGDDGIADPRTIETVAGDRQRPRCDPIGAATGIHCSVAHDTRFAVAVASDRPIGVDVTPHSERLLAVARIYMTDAERSRLSRSAPDRILEAARIWTAKEAVCKAAGIHLADTWHRLDVIPLDASRSRLRLDNRQWGIAIHDPVEAHLFTVATPLPDTGDA